MQENPQENAQEGGEDAVPTFRGLINLNKLIESAYNLEPLPPSVPRLAALCVSENANVDEIADVIVVVAFFVVPALGRYVEPVR